MSEYRYARLSLRYEDETRDHANFRICKVANRIRVAMSDKVDKRTNNIYNGRVLLVNTSTLMADGVKFAPIPNSF
jgi:hypothetical protein